MSTLMRESLRTFSAACIALHPSKTAGWLPCLTIHASFAILIRYPPCCFTCAAFNDGCGGGVGGGGGGGATASGTMGGCNNSYPVGSLWTLLSIASGTCCQFELLWADGMCCHCESLSFATEPYTGGSCCQLDPSDGATSLTYAACDGTCCQVSGAAGSAAGCEWHSCHLCTGEVAAGSAVGGAYHSCHPCEPCQYCDADSAVGSDAGGVVGSTRHGGVLTVTVPNADFTVTASRGGERERSRPQLTCQGSHDINTHGLTEDGRCCKKIKIT